MKKLFVIILIFTITFTRAQQSKLSLKECIALALNEQPRFQTEKIKSENSVFDVKVAKSALGPQVALTYNYQYNAVRPTSLVPTALTRPSNNTSMTGDFTELQFGTTWQQDFGVSLFQPLYDRQINSKITESRITEQLGILEKEEEKEEIIYEVVETYLKVSQKQLEYRVGIIDTIRTHKTVQLIQLGYQQGRILKTELNMALINHNNSKSILAKVTNELDAEYVNLGFLIGYDKVKEVDEKFYKQIDGLFSNMEAIGINDRESITSKILKTRDSLLAQKIISNKMSRLPTLAFDAFWGANQFNQNFRPFEADTWFGNSFLGVSLKLPLLSANGTKNKIAKLRGERAMKAQELLEDENRKIQEKKQLDISIRTLKSELVFLKENMALRKSSLAIYQARFSNAKANTYQINEEELLLQKSSELFYSKQSELWSAVLKMYKNQGRLMEFLN